MPKKVNDPNSIGLGFVLQVTGTIGKGGFQIPPPFEQQEPAHV
ncbi:hypothetical protein [Methylomonas methanica]|jgi:hypothetical protein|nr:hypothetical protein [Methylomonas methanica]